jgi:hypothetical protein
MSNSPDQKSKKAPAPGKRPAPVDRNGRGHYKREFTPTEIANVCDLIRNGQMSETAAIRLMGFDWETWRARRRENKLMDADILAAEKDLVDEMMHPGTILTILNQAVDKDSAQAVKVQVWGRFELAGKIDPERWATQHHKVDSVQRIVGLKEHLKAISDAGGDVGPGPSKPV